VVLSSSPIPLEQSFGTFLMVAGCLQGIGIHGSSMVSSQNLISIEWLLFE